MHIYVHNNNLYLLGRYCSGDTVEAFSDHTYHRNAFDLTHTSHRNYANNLVSQDQDLEVTRKYNIYV